MKYDFSKMIFRDIEDRPIEGGYKFLANALYNLVKDLDMLEIARSINKGEIVELDESAIEEIKVVIENQNSRFAAFMKKAVLDFLKTEGVKDE